MKRLFLLLLCSPLACGGNQLSAADLASPDGLASAADLASASDTARAALAANSHRGGRGTAPENANPA